MSNYSIQVLPDAKHESKKADLGTSSRWSFVVVTMCHRQSESGSLNRRLLAAVRGLKTNCCGYWAAWSLHRSKWVSQHQVCGRTKDLINKRQVKRSVANSVVATCSNLFPFAWHRPKLVMLTMLGGTSRQRIWYWRSFQQKFQMLLNAHMGEKMLLQTVRRMTEFTQIPSNSQKLFCLNHAQQTQQVQDRFGSVSISPSLFSQQHVEWMERFVRQPHCSIRASCLFTSFHARPRDSTLLTVMLSICPATVDSKHIHIIYI